MPRFTREELKETLKRIDLTVPPLALESLREMIDLLEELRPYREAAEKVAR